MAYYYTWFKVLHVISLISWMVGMLYLPRIFVYHTKVKPGSETDEIFQLMEMRLLRFIMNPAMIFTIIFGLILTVTYGLEAMGPWFHVKMLFVAILAAFHGLLARWRKDFAQGKNNKSELFYRVANEVPTVCMIVIVIMVIVKPFD